jgi:ribosomal-protein-serine acetyltransferase
MLPVRENLILRNHTESDATALFSVVNANRSHLRNFITWVDQTLKEEDSLEFIRVAQQQRNEQRGMSLGIFREEQLIGGIGMHQWDHTLRKAEIGYWLAKEEEGGGIMFDCARIFIAFLFEQLDLNKIEIRFRKENQKSARLAERLNFKVEGILRDALLMNGAFHDMVITGLLRKEGWNK